MASEQQLHRWAQRMRAEGLSRRTVTEWPAIVRRAARHAAADPCALTTEQLVDYLADLPSAGTRQTYFTALRAWHHWLTAEGVRADDPMGRLRRPRAPKGEPHPVATAHIERLLTSGIRRRTRTASLLAALQGLRVHEVAKVRGEDVDLVGMRFRTVGKGGTERWKPLHPIIAAEARDYPARGWWFPSYVRLGQPVRSDSLSAVISRAMKRAGIPGTAHSLRHWFGTELLATGANTRTVQSLLRHASLTSTQIYTLVNCDQERAALDALALPTQRTAPVPGGRTLEGVAR